MDVTENQEINVYEEEQDIDVKSTILHLLAALRFVKPKSIPDKTLENIQKYLSQISDPVVQVIQDVSSCVSSAVEEITESEPEQHIVEVDDAIMKLAFIRSAVDITYDTSGICYKKIKYSFDNVFDQNHTNSLILELSEFVMKRIFAHKDSSLVFYGYSGSGKSFLSRSIINLLNPTKYRLFQIYNNSIIAYYRGGTPSLAPEGRGRKITLDKFEQVYESRFVFECDAKRLEKIMSQFCIVQDNGMNANSSRAHTIIDLIFDSGGYVRILDLMGNEVLPKKSSFFSKNTIDEESKYINLSLYSVSQFLRDKRYKNAKCNLWQFIRTFQNIIFTLLFNDKQISDTKFLRSYNHLSVFEQLYSKKKLK